MAQRVVLAMSGGVDSSASALLLQQQGYEVIGLFMRSGMAEEISCAPSSEELLPIVSAPAHKQGCCSASDAADARRVADSLDIPFHALNFKDAFGRIQDYFADEYLAGRTPNPCVMCNNWLKFGKLWDFAQQVQADYIATGHYAQLMSISGELQPGLFRGLDDSKDQSYVLFGINKNLLDKILFPVGGHTKLQIRELAADTELRTAHKPDSQEICFIPNNDYANFIEQYRGPQQTAGDVVDTSGNIVGQHAGYENFTIGQRRGLGIAFGSPRFVVAIEPKLCRVVVGEKKDLARSQLEANGLNWLTDDVPTHFSCLAKIRYRHQAAKADVHVVDEDRLRVRFEEPQYGVAPGQAVVLYKENRVLGGGWIMS